MLHLARAIQLRRSIEPAVKEGIARDLITRPPRRAQHQRHIVRWRRRRVRENAVARPREHPRIRTRHHEHTKNSQFQRTPHPTTKTRRRKDSHAGLIPAKPPDSSAAFFALSEDSFVAA